MTDEFEYKEEGVISQSVGALVALFVGLGVLILVIILVTILGSKAYTVAEGTLDHYDTNNTYEVIYGDFNSSAVSAFSAYADSVAFISIIVLALVFFLVLALLATGMKPFSGGGTGAI